MSLFERSRTMAIYCCTLPPRHTNPKRRRGRLLTRAPLFFGLTAALLAGCQMPPSGQVTTLQTQNRVLTEQNNAQLTEIENLKAHDRQIENKLIDAEEQLALADQKLGTDRKKLANYQKERTQLRDQFTGYSREVKIPAGVSAELEKLARRHPSLQFDPQTGVAKLDADVTFDSGVAELKPQAEQVLADLAATLDTPDAREMRMMVAGHTDNQKIAGKEARQKYGDNWQLSTARALAVASYLHKSGIADARLAVSGYAGQQPIAPNDSAANRRRNRRVEIFVIPPETPIVGWTETSTSLY
jgi:chemotaxis protein MotB